MFKLSKKTSLFLSFFYVLGLGSCASTSKEVCDGKVVIQGKRGFVFNKNEEPLLCGDPELEAWAQVPLSQTEFHMRSFLKSRGYYSSSFSLQGSQLLVDPGVRYRVMRVLFDGVPIKFYDVGYVGWRGREFLSSTFDEIEGWTLRRLKNLGYACAKVSLKADLETQVVTVTATPGKQYTIPEIEYETYDSKKNLKPAVLQRFYAFHPGDIYRDQLFSLTSQRMESQGVVAYSNFLNQCEDDQLHIRHSVALGQPRVLRIGAGISTEEFPIGRIGWKNSRLGKNASILSADIYASQLRQEAQVSLEWHTFEKLSRWFLQPTFQSKHVNEKNQEYLAVKALNYLGTSLDLRELVFDFKAGPAVTYEKSIDGPSIGEKKFVTWETKSALTSHDYQVYASDPQEGYTFSLDTSSLALTSLGEANVHHLSLSGTQLFNVGNYDPHRYIFGYRFGLDSLLTDGSSNSTQFLPADYFVYLGGDRDVRGFGRQELPLVGDGSLSRAFIGLEFRAPAWLPVGFDPFVSMDAGWLGKEEFEFERTIYWSPGIGLRWKSPIGAIRTTLARGFVTQNNVEEKKHEHIQFFIGLGREF